MITGVTDELRVRRRSTTTALIWASSAWRRPSGSVGYLGHTIDDDAAGTSLGNGDGLLNPTEQIELPVQVYNFGTVTATAVTGTLTCEDGYVTILDDAEEFGDIPPGSSAWSRRRLRSARRGGAPEGHRIRLGLDLHAGAETWHSLIELRVTAAALVYEDQTLYGFGGELDPGEACEISVQIANAGGAAAEDLVGTLISDSDWLVVTDMLGTFGTIGAGASGENTADHFGSPRRPGVRRRALGDPARRG